ncbi:hypothetical protein GCM10009726_35040 [Nocardioides furvisabuli]|uniref:Glycosyl transferase family 1 domain-containing protein n=1 Tax=Nocardioides furvisabuli TaxID=375542 RepID=A0ABN2XR50_9ACTN
MRTELTTNFGVNLFGYVTSNQSQGVIARNLVATLRSQGVPLAITDVAPTFGGTGDDETYCMAGCDEASDQPYPLTVYCFIPSDAEDYLRRHPHLARRDRLSAVVVFVEHRVMRPELIPFLRAVDLVLTPTDFVAEAVASSVPDSVTVPFRQSVVLPSGVTADRSRWGMQEGTTTFVFGFDTYSDSQRKNPLGLVRAFRAAFPERADVALLIKVGHLDEDERLGGQALQAVAEADGDARITFLQQNLDYVDVLGLYASADVVSSLHRSEGLGLLMMEAMSLGTPVMATGFSGNLDFMTAHNSILVDHDLVTVDTPYPGYQHVRGVDVWAEPDHDSAVRAMRALADDQGLRAALADQGRRDMEARRRLVAGGDLLDELRQAFHDPALWSAHRRRRARLTWLARRPRSRYGWGDVRHVVADRIKKILRRS